MHLVIFDLETIGFPARHHEIIQIAAVRMLHGEVLANECSLLVEENPQSAPLSAENIHVPCPPATQIGAPPYRIDPTTSRLAPHRSAQLSHFLAHPNSPLPTMHLVIFDLETTGFSPRLHEIIQIAAVRMRHGEVLATERFATFVRPQSAVPAHITEITGISGRDVRHAPEPASCLAAFSRFVGDATLVAHNGRRFDMPFLRESSTRHGLPLREVKFFDSMDLSRRLWAGEPSHSLDAVAERLRLSMKDLRRHDARGDVQLLASAVVNMWQRLGASLDLCPVSLETGHLPA